jgi:hypothetical protein
VTGEVIEFHEFGRMRLSRHSELIAEYVAIALGAGG